NLANTYCKADVDCGPGAPGVRCDKQVLDARTEADGSLVGRCTLPYAVRNLTDPADPSSADLGPRKLVYYLNDAFPHDLAETAAQIGDEYDAVFKGIYKDLT